VNTSYQKRNPVILFIGTIFSLLSLFLFGFSVRLLLQTDFTLLNNDTRLFLGATIILAITTGVIAGFLWYIIFRKNWIKYSE
jgi:hypothetical protein